MLLVDSMAIAYRSKHAVKSLFLKYKEQGRHFDNQIVFTFLDQVKKICNDTKEKDLAFFWDGPSELNLRKKIYSNYKNKEEPDKTALEKEYDSISYDQFNKLMMDVIPSLGFKNSFMFTGYESDDLIAVASKKANGDNKMVIASSDNDLFQLMNDNVSMYILHTKEIFTKKDFMDKYDINPEDWWCVKCYAGCTNDNVPNLPGVKEKTAIKFLKGTLPSHYKTHKVISDERNIRFLERNESVVRLPLSGTPDFEIKKHSLYQADFEGTFERYRFKAFMGDEFYKWVWGLRLK